MINKMEYNMYTYLAGKAMYVFKDDPRLVMLLTVSNPFEIGKKVARPFHSVNTLNGAKIGPRTHR